MRIIDVVVGGEILSRHYSFASIEEKRRYFEALRQDLYRYYQDRLNEVTKLEAESVIEEIPRVVEHSE